MDDPRVAVDSKPSRVRRFGGGVLLLTNNTRYGQSTGRGEEAVEAQRLPSSFYVGRAGVANQVGKEPGSVIRAGFGGIHRLRWRKALGS